MVERHIMTFAQDMLGVFPALQIQGARRVGKSTFASMLVDGKPHVSLSLDHDDVRQAAMDDPRGFVQAAEDGILVLDEVQRAPGLLLAIKAAIDEDPRPGRFVLTGSSDLLRSTRMPDSLAGRAVTVPLWGFSQGEIVGTADDFAAWAHGMTDPMTLTSTWTKKDYISELTKGSYPEARALSDVHRRVWLRNYTNRLLNRDVAEIGRKVSTSGLARTLRLVAANQSGELVKARIADDTGLPESSVANYLDVLSILYLTTDLNPWTPNLTAREVSRHKVSVADAGLALSLSRTSPEQLVLPTEAIHLGGLLEGFVVAELIKQQTWTKTPFELYHYRAVNGPELDLVMEFDDGRVFLLEVKASQTYRGEYVKSMKELAAKLGPRFIGGTVLTTSTTPFRYTDMIWGLPLSALWEAPTE
ncbi:MAG: ATP-binding protein [Propionibacteriaceae bacterium]|nr:ATP-binding protein [Propionibacteriaceae bacterium]